MSLINRLLSQDKTKRILVLIITFIFIYIVLATSLVTKKYTIKEGDIAKVNIKAPREIKDEIMTEARIKAAVDGVPPQYDKDSEVKSNIIDSINKMFLIISENENLEEIEKLEKIKEKSPISLTDEDFQVLLKLGKKDLVVLQSFLVETLNEVYSENILADNNDDIKRAQEVIQLKFNGSKFSKVVRDIGTTIGFQLIKPNLFYSEAKTEALKNEVIKDVPPVMIKKDKIIVNEGEEVTNHQIYILKELGLLNENASANWYIYITLFIFEALIIFLQWGYLHRFHNEIFNNWKKLALISIVNCIVIIFSRTLGAISPFMVPLAMAPMLLTLLIDYRVSLAISVINCMFLSLTAGFNVEATLLAVINAVLGATVLKKMQQRNDILYSSLYIAGITSVLVFVTGFLLSSNIFEVLMKSGFAIISSVLSGILTIGFLPFFESSFDIVTTIKLLELSNPNHPLLKKLLLEAPGTYHHSILVANLAEVATEQVGGNSVLARVSAYYHDIGKVKRPYFFKENQLGNDNPHKKITPNLSTLIITSHIKDGIELAREYKLPQVIRDVIEQHHGTSIVKYFYITMKNNSEKPEEIKEEDFMYPGPIPHSKEAGIIMLADSVEAAVRSITEPSKGKIEEMVNNIIKDRLNEGQLDDCDLTLKDLNKIRKSFLKALSGIYHERIEYPSEKSGLK